MRVIGRFTAALAAIAVTGMIAGPAAPALASRSAGSARTAASARPVAFECQGWQHGQVRTHLIYLNCLGQVLVKVPRWQYWTPRSARSLRATLYVDTCVPNCERGRYRHYAAAVVFYRVRSHHGIRYFSRLRLSYFHGRHRSYVYRWARYPGATVPGWTGGPSGQG